MAAPLVTSEMVPLMPDVSAPAFLGLYSGLRKGSRTTADMADMEHGMVRHPVPWVMAEALRTLLARVRTAWMLRLHATRLGARRVLRILSPWIHEGQ